MKSYNEIAIDIMKRCGQLGFTGIDGRKQLYATREYVMPECVGCMVKVRHDVSIRVYNASIHIGFNAVMFNRPCDTEANVNMNTKCIEIYDDYLILDDNELDEWCDFIDEKINCMFNRIDEKLKNVLGMERVV